MSTAPRVNIIAVDDEPAVLNSVERDLRQNYGRDYRVIKVESGAEALDVLPQLKGRGETVALFVVDQRMPQMNGVEFLEQTTGVFPDVLKADPTYVDDLIPMYPYSTQVALRKRFFSP